MSYKQTYLIDDDKDIRKSLYFMLSARDIHVWPFVSADDFLDHFSHLSPAPILLDIRMAGMDGLQLLEVLNERAIRWPTIVLTAHGDVATAVRAMKLGAIEFIEKPFAPELVIDALDQAYAQLAKDEDKSRDREHARRQFEHLTLRERETLAILIEGALNKEVAHRMGLSVRTVEMHRANALAKLNVKRVSEVVQLANSAGFDPALALQDETIGAG